MLRIKNRPRKIDGSRDGGQLSPSNGSATNGQHDTLPVGQDAIKLTQPLPIISPGNGSGYSAAGSSTIRAARVRVGTEQLNGTTAIGDVFPEGQSNSNGTSRRLADTVLVQPSSGGTSRLRQTDLAGMKFKLGYEAATLTPRTKSRASTHNRTLPYFLMRHRNMRSRSHVGYIRSQVAGARYGRMGGFGVVARVVIVLWIAGLLATLSGLGAGFAGASWYISKLPPVDPANLAASIAINGITTQTTKFYDRNGTQLYDLIDEATGPREELTLDKISPLVISATVATEDGSFYTNPGVDPYALLRAVTINLGGNGKSGASTITQQVARNVFFTEADRRAQSLERKLREAILAVQIAQRYKKSDVMSLYLNQNYYGHRAYGIGAAALTYFGKQARDLTLSEAALLAGLPQAPSEYDPFIHPDQAKLRQARVLDLMA
ncbi:MAG: transglycosylase domain-containing protein, partial [Chloroflexota bacterium]|nr:transglycosylase domain-containing protein [Chloroflexota bacterium]